MAPNFTYWTTSDLCPLGFCATSNTRRGYLPREANGVPDWALRFRVKLTAGDVFASRLNKSVPVVGFVAGGGQSPYSAPLSTTEPIGVTGVNPDTFKLARQTPAPPLPSTPTQSRMRSSPTRQSGRCELRKFRGRTAAAVQFENCSSYETSEPPPSRWPGYG